MQHRDEMLGSHWLLGVTNLKRVRPPRKCPADRCASPAAIKLRAPCSSRYALFNAALLRINHRGRCRDGWSRTAHPSATPPSPPPAMSSRPSAISSCTSSTRSAEQRCPREAEAPEHNVVHRLLQRRQGLSTIAERRPPVLTVNGMIGPTRPASVRPMARAVSVPPVKAMPDMRVSATSATPIVSPLPGTGAARHAECPPRAATATARFANQRRLLRPRAQRSPNFPAASAAATCPVKIASGKFHGLMHAKIPRGCSDSVLRSPVGPAITVSPIAQRACAA